MRAKANKIQVAQPAKTYINNQDLTHASSRTLSDSVAYPLAGLAFAAFAVMSYAAPTTAQTSSSYNSSQPATAQPTSTQSAPTTGATGTNSTQVPAGRGTTAVPAAGSSTPPAPSAIQAPQTPTRTVIPAPQSPTSSFEDTYVLGAGDEIQVDIFDVPEFSGANGRYTVLVDGSINAPWVGRVSLRGLTLDQASRALTRAYAPYIRDPVISVNLLAPRTLKVSVVGEVRRPGSYVISPQAQTNNQNLVAAGTNPGTTSGGGGQLGNQWPTVTQALQAAGGITQLANLRDVQIRRPQADGSEQLIDLNLWELLRTGELNQDITLRDRDTLVVPTATDINPQEAQVAGSASFAPATIQVNVVGEVLKPGTVQVAPNTSLNQALLSAGGFDRRRARTSKVELVRLNPNGTAVRRVVPVDLAAGINDATNPSLREGDTIIVNRSGLTATTDFLNNLLQPIGTVFGLVNTLSNFGGGN